MSEEQGSTASPTARGERPGTPTEETTQCYVNSHLEKIVDDKGVKWINSYAVGALLGKGSYAKVKLCRDSLTKKNYALKIMNKHILKKKRITLQQTVYDAVTHGIDNLKRMSHPNIVCLYELIDDPNKDKLYMVLEYVDGGTLADHIGSNHENSEERLKPLTEKEARKIFRQVLAGLKHAHEKGVAHRDIKPENIMMSKDKKVVKIADFGVSCRFKGVDEAKSLSVAGSPAFLPPESCRGHATYKEAAPGDVWAAAVSLFQVTAGYLPFGAPNVSALYKLIVESTPTYPDKMSAELKDLLSKCLQKESSKRLTVDEMLQHKWFAKD